MLSTDYTLTEFVIEIKHTSLEEVAEFNYWTDVDDVAKISQRDLAKYGPNKERARRRETHEPTKPTTAPQVKRKSSVRFDLTVKSPTKPNHSTTDKQDRSSLQQQQLSKPLQTILEPNSNQIPKRPTADCQTSAKQTNDTGCSNNNNGTHVDGQRQQQPQQQQPNDNKRQTYSSAEDNILNMELLTDLLPPDIDTIDLNSDKIYVSTLNDAESDSVSYVSSGNSDEDND